MRIACYLFLLATSVGCSFGGQGTVPVASSQALPANAVAEARVTDQFFTVAAYDPLRDAGVDLRATLALAKRKNKRVLLEIGGDW
jgi:hypothetical protein